MSDRIFISYSAIDKDFIKELRKVLDKLRISYFLDTKNIELGSNISEEIDKGLIECSEVIVVLSPASIKSVWVVYEMGLAKGLGKKVIPLLTHPSIELPDYLKLLRYTTNLKELEEYFKKEEESKGLPNSTVYISFTGEDRPIAQHLADYLRRDDINVWLDKKNLMGGEPLDKTILRAIDQCRVFIPLISEYSKRLVTDDGNLKYHIREWEFAYSKYCLQKDFRIIPVILDSTAYLYPKFKNFFPLRIPDGQGGDYEKLKNILIEIL
jgi:hypothetical protein